MGSRLFWRTLCEGRDAAVVTFFAGSSCGVRSPNRTASLLGPSMRRSVYEIVFFTRRQSLDTSG